MDYIIPTVLYLSPDAGNSGKITGQAPSLNEKEIDFMTKFPQSVSLVHRILDR